MHLEPTLSVNGHNVLTWTLLSDHRNVRRLQKPKCAAKYGLHHTDVCRFAYMSIRTVALTVKANGEKLPPKVIFKGVRQLKINVPPRVQVSVHKKGWMDEEGKLKHCLF